MLFTLRLLLLLCLFLLPGACSLRNNGWDSQAYIVRPKESLYSIAWRYALDYRDLARWNNIQAPYIIQPGQKLWLNDYAMYPAPATSAAPDIAKPIPPDGRKSGRIEESRPKVAKLNTVAPPTAWLWPTAGRVTKQFQGSKSASQGIAIEGKLKQSVIAAAGGKVVYSGNGLIGYGNLVIIKHNDTYLSAYAHNHTLLVNEGEQVKGGQKIAEMGRVGSGQAQLHFEIRKDGEPVNPLRYLPAP